VLLDNNIRPANEDDSIWRNLKNMYKRFESDEIPGARVRVSLNDASKEVTCDGEGYFRVALHPAAGIPPGDYWRNVQIEVLDTPIANLDIQNVLAEGQIIVPPTDAQFGVISDLDDTVVKTDVLNLFKMLRNTILHNAYTRLPFEGVAAFYRALQRGTTDTINPIFYVSSSPYNLYDVIVEFYRIQDIPLGPVFLRDIGFTEHAMGGLDHSTHKLTLIQNLLDRYPSLPFILIGDSGQEDAPIYQTIVERNPGRIRAIYIRDVNKPGRAEVVRQVADDLQKHDVDVLLVDDTVAAAQHAAAKGFITPAALETIQAERNKSQT
jgi:phosphatidate phosphatase APP1